jgi:hypothetical protein
MTTEELAILISKAAKASFTQTRERLGKDQLIAYSIYSHDTADSCSPLVASKSGSEKFESGSESGFLFTPDEWDQQDGYSCFDEVNNELLRLYDLGDYEQDTEWHNKFRELVFEVSVRGLELLIAEGFFGSEAERDKLFIIFSLSDSETSQTHFPDWVERLNTASVNKAYLKYRATEG